MGRSAYFSRIKMFKHINKSSNPYPWWFVYTLAMFFNCRIMCITAFLCSIKSPFLSKSRALEDSLYPSNLTKTYQWVRIMYIKRTLNLGMNDSWGNFMTLLCALWDNFIIICNYLKYITNYCGFLIMVSNYQIQFLERFAKYVEHVWWVICHRKAGEETLVPTIEPPKFWYWL